MALASQTADQRLRGAYDSACFTRSGENGTRRMRTPVASKIALAIAAATGRIDGSPAPVGGDLRMVDQHEVDLSPASR